ncbi:MAG: thiamine pyrophosphate-binding protein [Archangiaceae bacterium]|nr:thiamine pyrophosphate-binding protein [Archangiaceae bacterium]
MKPRHGGDLIAAVLSRWGVRHIFTLCGGHISPILVGAKDAGIAVIDCRDERNAVFAADAVARMTGIPGIAAVTAGPGVTNALTALKNAQLAQTPLVLFGGATATVLKGRGALQDIDQTSLVKSAVKWMARCTMVSQLEPTVERALHEAQSGVPGPVFVEVPVDVLYPEDTVRDMFMKESGADKGATLQQKAIGLYLKGHLYRQFHLPYVDVKAKVEQVTAALPQLGHDRELDQIADALKKAQRPALVVGSQTMTNCTDAGPLAAAVASLGVPVWLGGTSRGLLGRDSPIQFRHARGKALKDADVVVVAGFPFDFRMKYGLGINRKATLVSANLSSRELTKNRRPDFALQMPAAEFVKALAQRAPKGNWEAWLTDCKKREAARDDEIAKKANPKGPLVDPIHFFKRLEEKLADDSVLVVDGGDFVATAAYILKPRRPLSWLDPGVFGTLGVGGGFAVGAASVRKSAEVWIIYGDGSSAYSLSEFDTFVRHGMAPIAVVGTDASWGQIARDQVTLLGSDVGTTLVKTAYHKVAEGYGGVGLLLDDPAKTDAVIDEAKALAKQGRPVCINVHLQKTDFREGSISI